MTRTVVAGSGGGSSGGGVPSNNNWASGTFGTGLIQVYGVGSHTFTVPSGISSVRVRCWGAGGGGCGSSSSYSGGGGGGFAMKTITGLTSGTDITVTVGAGGAVFTSGGTTSFGTYVSATGGSSANSSSSEQVGGSGSGGDVNYIGGSSSGNYANGGGCASMWGNGAMGNASLTLRVSGGAGAGQNTNSEGYGNTGLFMATSFGSQGLVGSGNATSTTSNNSGLLAMPLNSIDMIGTGPGGGVAGGQGKNGGGGGMNTGGSFPGGGSGSGSSSRCIGGDGLLIVEW